MAIDGIIILDHSGRPIVQSNFRSSPPSYPLLHIDAYIDAKNNLPPGDTLPDPVIPVHSYNCYAACCNTSTAGLAFLAPIRGDGDPLFAFAFLDSFLNILVQYLGDLSVHVIRDHLDVVYQLLEEMLDDGRPLTTEANALRDIVLPPSFFNKMLSISGIPGLTKASASPFASPIPWRKAGMRYNQNEILFDLAEEMDAVVSSSGTTLSYQVWGNVNANCKLSGTPDLTLAFQGHEALIDVSFHPCVRIPKWVKDRVLSFVPPDGRFNLMTYRYQTHPETDSNIKSNVQLPLTLKHNYIKTEDSITLEFFVTSRMRDNLEGCSLQLVVGEGARGVNCLNSAGSSWGFDPKSLILRWEIPMLPPSSTHTLKSSWSVSGRSFLRPSCALINFTIPHRPFSSLKIRQLKLTGETYKPYKGLRGNGTSRIEWRL